RRAVKVMHHPADLRRTSVAMFRVPAGRVLYENKHSRGRTSRHRNPDFPSARFENALWLRHTNDNGPARHQFLSGFDNLQHSTDRVGRWFCEHHQLARVSDNLLRASTNSRVGPGVFEFDPTIPSDPVAFSVSRKDSSGCPDNQTSSDRGMARWNYFLRVSGIRRGPAARLPFDANYVLPARVCNTLEQGSGSP